MKRIIPYPLLLITAIVLDRVVISSIEIDMGQSLRALVVLLLLASMTILVIQYFIKDWHYTNFIVLMIVAIFFVYRSLFALLKTNFPLQANFLGVALIALLCMVYAVAVSRRVWRSIRNPAHLTYYFSIVFILLLGFQAVRLARDVYSVLKSAAHPDLTAFSTLTGDLHLQNGPRPDIYIIVMDGYGRQDILQTIYEQDNSGFINQLEERGFYVANNSHSNYIQTAYTMASFWNFDYLQPWDTSYDYGQYLFQSIEDNRVFQLLDEIGYTTVSFEGASDFAQIRNSDLYLSNFLPLNKFETLLLIDSPFEPLSNIFELGIPIPTYKTHRQRILFELDMLKEIPISIPTPKIVYAHILAPHPPFVFDQHGNAFEPQRPYGLWDGNEYKGNRKEYWDGYKKQTIFVNTELIKVIDAILAKSETPPIILLMGDHGPASMFNWRFDMPGCLWERTGNLYAMLLPEYLNDGTLYPSISPVNTFRVIFNTYFGTDLTLLEDKSYLMFLHQPSLKVDITDTRDSLEGCAIPKQ